MKKILGLFFLFFLFAPLAEAACPSGVTASACYYVATTGDNSRSCATAENISTPKQTIASGVSCLAAGRILYLRAGTYAETIDTNNLTVPSGTSASNVVTIAKYPGDGNVTLRPTSGNQVVGIAKTTNSYITLDGLILDAVNLGSAGNAYSLWGAHHIKCINCEMLNAAKHGVKIATNSHHNEVIGCKSHDNGTSATLDHGFYIEGDDNILDRCDFYNNAANGGQIYNGGDGLDATNNILRNSRLFDNVRNGAVLSQGSNHAYNNLFWDNGRHGLQVSSDCSGCRVYNNTSYSNVNDGIIVESPSSGTLIKNNISAANSGANMSNNGSGTIYANNLCFSSGGTTNCSVTSDPGFIAAGSDNFALSSNSSSAANAGVALGSGFLYNNSSKPDIGAHQLIIFAGAVIPDQATDNQVVMTFVNNVFPPLLPATGCSGFTVLRNTVGNTITSCVRTANNQITLTVTTPFTNSDTQASVSYANTGTVTDSALFGKVNTQRLNTISATTLIVSGLTGGTPPPPPPTSSLVQLVYRFESYGGTEAIPDSIYPINTPIRIPPNTCTRLRILICNGDVALGSSGYSPYASRNSGAYSVVPDGPALTTGISFAAGTGTPPPELIAGVYTTEQLAGPGTFIPGGAQLSATETPNVALLANEDTEFVAALCVGAGNSAGTTFDIQWRKAGGVALDTYTQIPQVIISGGTSQTGNR